MPRSAAIWRLSVGLLLVGLWTAGSSVDATPTSQSENSSSNIDSPMVVRQLFFQRLKAAADSGDLFNPLSISKLLGIDFKIESSESVPIPPDCSKEWKSRSVTTTKAVADESSWYRVLPSGVRSMPVPAAFINPATKTGDATFGYTVVRRIQCTDRSGLQDGTSATISFGGLPSFSCISGSDITRLFPEAKFQMATDGVFFYNYQGKVNDDAGTNVEFFFRMGAACALAVTVTQDQKLGLRYKRADSKRRNCQVQTDREFCARHGPFSWSDGGALNEMREYADKICGTTDSIARQDTERGVQPEPLPKWKRGVGPCQMHDD